MKSDRQLARDVVAELDWDPALDAAGIGVMARDGIVTLTGHVASFAARGDAERAAWRTGSLHVVTDALQVRLPPACSRDDAVIADTVRNCLRWSIAVRNKPIDVAVHAGYVTLSGTVKWLYQREAAEQAVRHVTGVTGLCDRIVIVPPPDNDAAHGATYGAQLRAQAG